jgi:uncharacterized membrane protein YdbT with pleckstrin-like domain
MSGSPPEQPAWLTLTDGERVWLRTAPSRNLVLAALAVGFVLLLTMSVAVSAMGDLATGRAVSLTVLLAIVALLLAAFLYIRRNDYVLTSERACAGVGLGSKRTRAVALADVQDVTVEQSGWQQLVNLGTLRFVTAGEDLRFALVENPAHLHQRALQFVDVD